MKNKITPELLQKIKDAVTITEVVGEHVVLKKSGANYTGLCPFHSERSPSFSVSESKGLYHCYGCKKGGDLIGFTMDIHGLSFPEAVEELAERARIPLPKDWGATGSGSPEEEKRRAAAREKQSLYYKLNRFVAAFYHHGLGQMPPVQEYLRKRGVSADEVRNFYLGAAPSSWDGLTQHLISKKAPMEIAKELGLIRPSPKSAPQGGLGHFDLFRARAMFPIIDLRGKIVGFGGRILPGLEKGIDTDGPKYMNSPESPVFHKSKIAYGLFHAQKHVREKDELILVEGYFDVIALHAAGFQNVVATCGTALTVDHLNLFRRFASKITVLFDGDKAGISATERAMELGLTQGAVLYGAAMPEGLDPDELLFNQDTGAPEADAKARMQEILDQAVPLLDARIAEQIAEAAKGPEARTQALKQIGQWLAEYRDPVGREVRMQDVQSRLGISRQLLEHASGQSSGHSSGKPTRVPPPGFSRPPQKPPTQGRGGPTRPSAADHILLRALVAGGKSLEKFQETGQKLPPEVTIADLFDYFPARAFLARFLENGQLSGAFSIPAETANDSETDPQIRSILTEAWVSGAKTPRPGDGQTDSDPDSDLRGALNRAMGKIWARFSQRIKAALQDAEAKKDAGLHAQLSKEYLDVQRKMKEFISFYDEA